MRATITPLLKSALEPIVARHRLLRLLRALALTLAVCLLAAWLLRGYSAAPTLLMLGFAIAGYIVNRRIEKWAPDYLAVARGIETRHPELHALLLTAIEQRPDPASGGGLHFLQQRVIAHAVEESRRHSWLDAIPSRVLWLWGTGAVALFIGFSVLLFSVHRQTGKRTVQAPPRAADAPKDEEVTVSPGDTEIERGAGMVILATFHRDVPSQAELAIERENEPPQKLPLVKNLDDPVFGGGVAQVEAPFSYRVEYAGKATRDFKVTVFEHPRLDRADATLVFPEYTKLPAREIPDTRRISAVEGTKLGVEFQLNKPVATAVLVAKDGAEIPLEVKDGVATASLRDFAIQASAQYELKLTDSDGRANKVPATFVVDALPNRRPELKFVTPKGDRQVTPIEEIAFRAEVWDDFGLGRYGMTIRVGEQDEKEVELGRDSGRDEKREAEHLLKLEELGVKPDELISWHLWAEDTGADGQIRRTGSDMFFAEVKPFEEIFRAGDGSEGGQRQQQGGGQGGPAAQRAAEQKDVVIATWNLQRAEEAATGEKPTPKFREDLPVIRDGQAESLAKTKELAGQLEDPKSLAFAETAVKEMEGALGILDKAAKEPAAIPEAVGAEQSAYNALLKLAAHEYRVSKQQNQGQQGQQGQRSQQQLDNLKLKDEEKRYETKSEAEPMQNEQQREQLAMLNRLKELAQRQNDINERVKELQTALEEAKTEKEKEEIRRQLARLREEQQQQLADIDEARQRMEESSQQAQFADERRQLEQTREEAQKAAEALDRKEATQALASGTRAAEQLEKMKEDFRRKTTGQFNEDMRQMRTEARDVAQKQEEISDKLNAEEEKPQRRTLDGSGRAEELAKDFEEQGRRLGALTEDMKRVSEQAEAAEPLLARELYDTLRKAAQAGTPEVLDQTRMLAERGYEEQARQFEARARKDIDELKEGVERAAESVLGDEAEGLRQARAELDALSEQIDREIARARPDLAQAGSARQPSERDPNGQPGEEPSPDRTPRPAEGSQPGGNTEPPQDSPEGQRGASANTPQPGEPSRRPGANPNPESGESQAQNPEQQGQPGQQPGQGEAQQNEQGQPASPQDQPGQGAPGRQGQEGSRGQRGQGQQAQPGQGDRSGQEGQQPGQQGQRGQQQGRGGQGGGGGTGGRQDGEPSEQNTGANGEGGSRLAELADSLQRQRGGRGGGGGGSGPEDEPAGPLTGDNYADWADRLRNVEEMVDSPEIRAEAARIRERAKAVRAEFKRHSIKPKWDMVQTQISRPLAELRERLSEELARRESKENLVPIDRDPVPSQYADRVRRYYEELGQSR